MADLTGLKFGKLTVLEVSDKRTATGNVHWWCLCDCGNKVEKDGYKLRKGRVKSCGCSQRNWGHGGTGTHLFSVWRGVKNRCYNSKNTSYKYYGDKGVKVCEDWLKFENFRDWALNNGYSPELTIDRLDSKGDYEPNNCQWATYETQNRKLSKLCEQDVADIRGLLINYPRMKKIDICRKYKICTSTLSNIRRGKTWKGIPPNLSI